MAPSPAAPATPAATSAPATATADAFDLEMLAGGLDAALARKAELEPLARQVLEDALTSLNAIHKAALTAIVRARRDDERGEELLFELVDDSAVRMALSMHGLIRSADPMTVAQRILDTIRPGIQSHGGDVDLVRLEDGVAYVRLSGACNGCSMASVTMRDGVEKALVQGVASINAVEVLTNEPAAPELLQITHVKPAAAAPMADTGWFKTFPVERIAIGTLEAMSLTPRQGEAVEVIVVNAAGQMAAYVNACAHQGMPLDKAIVDATEGTLTCPWHGFCFDTTTGECLTMPGAQLEALPLRIEDGHVWVRAGS
jgi:nitrite reductase/ring-hydroxylating ferredoxin subunit/Fe-S cluster biogenesis protein NfuA